MGGNTSYSKIGKTSFILACALVFGILISTTLVQASENAPYSFKSDKDPAPIEEVIIVDPGEYIFPDEDWPIVKVERTKIFNPETKDYEFEETIYRREPQNAGNTLRPSQEAISQVCKAIRENAFRNFLDSFNIEVAFAATCTYHDRESLSKPSSLYSGANKLTGFVYSYSQLFCAGNCDLYDYHKLYQTNVSWWRNSSKWTVTNATYQWGCSGSECPKCGGGTYTGGMISGTIGTVQWANTNQSMVTISSSSSFPAMNKLSEGTPGPVAKSYGKGYFDGVYKGTTSPTIVW